MTKLTRDQKIAQFIDSLPQKEQEELLQILEEEDKEKFRKSCKSSFLIYVKAVWPEFVHGEHHEKMAKAFEKVAKGELKRVIINMPPRHTKSEFASFLLPSWYLGQFPNRKIIQCSNTAELAVGFGRKVRNLVDSPRYKEIFPGVGLATDSKAAGRWNTNRGGNYFAIGVSGTVTGIGADCLIIDDPHSEQEAAIAAQNPEIYDKVTEWFTSGPRQRLQPGGAIVIVMCMTGDTPVLMASGVEKQLRDIRPGNFVATFDDGKLSVARVNHWQSNGIDFIYKIQTRSGKTLRANERHPFLVMKEGILEWTRLKHLVVGDEFVSLKGDPQDRISDFTTDPIVSITQGGQEEVFDVEIDRTENFIANGVVSHNTRWSKKDLTGAVLKKSMEVEGDEWEVINLPAILPSGQPLWPQFWDLKELETLKAELPVAKWNAQYQQSPTSEEGALIKREWWRVWDKPKAPKCEMVIQSWDTAFLKTETSDYSACTTWGVFFKDEDPDDAHIILLDAYKERLEFVDLKKVAFRMWEEWNPDAFIVEAKASGAPLVSELRRMGIPVQAVTPSRGNDKVVRLNSISDLFASGKVWYPDGKRWAQEVIEEMAEFPHGEHDDLVDAAVYGLMRFRKGGFIRLPTDWDEENIPRYRQKGYYTV